MNTNQFVEKKIGEYTITPIQGTEIKLGSCSHHSGEAELWAMGIRVQKEEDSFRVLATIEFREDENPFKGGYSESVLIHTLQSYHCSVKNGSTVLELDEEEESDLFSSFEEYFDSF